MHACSSLAHWHFAYPMSSVLYQHAHWQGHRLPVTSVDIMKSHNLLISTSKDTKVCLWTWTGGLVGVFGLHEWDLSNQSTWQDPGGHKTKTPLKETDLLFLQVIDNQISVQK